METYKNKNFRDKAVKQSLLKHFNAKIIFKDNQDNDLYHIGFDFSENKKMKHLGIYNSLVENDKTRELQFKLNFKDGTVFIYENCY